MEAAGLAIGIVGLAGLFNSCLDSLARVQSYRSSKSDSHVLNTHFRAVRTRFEQWGSSVGFSHGKLMQEHHAALDNQDIARVVEDILRIITKTIINGAATQASKTIGPLQQSEVCSTDVTQSKRKRLRWALGGKEGRIEQVDMFEMLVQQLYNLVSPSVEDDHAGRVKGKADIEDLRRMLDMIQHEMQAEVRRNVFLWLGKSPPSDRYDDSIRKRVDNTCDWIFERPAFNSWLMEGGSSKPSILWINGPAGFGKTILCAHIVQHLSILLATPVSYFFFASDHESRENPYLALRSLISQVAAHHDAAFECIRESWEVDLGEVASRRTLIKIFKTVVDAVPGCTFVIDGLDECAHLANGGTSVAGFLSDTIDTVSKSNVKLLFASRDEPGIRSVITDSSENYSAEYRIEPGDVRSDTATFSQSIVDKVLSNKSEDIRTAISDAMTERCQGQFLWLKMQAESLRGGMSKKRLQQVVENTPSGLDRLYDHNWARINEMDQWERDRVFALLRWTAFANRPLTIYEITEAVLITQFEELDPEELPDTLDDDYVRTEIVGLCGPLLEVKQSPEPLLAGDGTVHIPHFSVRQYLLHKLPIPTWLQENGQLQESYERLQHTVLAKACLQYISLPQVWARQTDQRASDKTFLDYAAKDWFFHVSLGFQDSPIIKLSTELLNHENPVYGCLAKYLAQYTTDEDADVEQQFTPLEYAIYLGWTVMAKSLVTHSNVNEIGWGGTPPIFSASYRGMPEVVSKLLQLGAYLTIVDPWKQTPLHIAALVGSEQVVRLLVEQGADLTAQSEDGQTPLHYALIHGHIGTCEYLIRSGSSLTIRNIRERTPLHLASHFGHSEVVRLILENGPDTLVTDADVEGWHPLLFASASGDIKTFETLFEHGASALISVRDLKGSSSLDIAAYLGHVAMVKLLLNHGGEAMLTTANQNGSTSLHFAASSEFDNDEVAELLLGREAETIMAMVDNEGRTPLYIASASGHTNMLKLLLNRGFEATIATLSAYGDTPLHLAARMNHFEVVKQLLNISPTHCNLRDQFGCTPLFVASRFGNHEVVDLLLSIDSIDLNSPDWMGSSPIFAAVANGHLEVVKLLISRGAIISPWASIGQSLLWWARRNGNPKLVQLLEDQEILFGVPTLDAYTRHEPPSDDADPVVFDSSSAWCDVCTLTMEGGQGYECLECTYQSVLICSECFDRGFQFCDYFHMIVPN